MRRVRQTAIWLCVLAAFLSIAPSALAAWIVAGTGSGYAQARLMPAGNTPVVNVANRSVTVSWAPSQFGGGPPVNGYEIKRYDASTGTVQTIGASCSGVITLPTCTESPAPPGSWRYTVTPRHGAWVGAESPQASAVTVLAPALTFSSPTTFTALPTNLAGTLNNFIPGSTVTYRLDDPSSGTVLAGTTTPSTIPASGTAAVSVTIPTATTNGPHTVYAVGNQGDVASASFTVDGPNPTSVLLQNVVTAGSPRRTDRIDIFFDQQLAVASMCSTWSGNGSNQSIAADNVAWVGILNNAAPGGNDQLQLFTSAAACGGAPHFGTINMGSPNFVTADTYYGGAGAGNRTTVNWTAGTFRLRITLGALAAGPNPPGTVGAAVTATYTPDPLVTNPYQTPVTGTAQRTAVQF